MMRVGIRILRHIGQDMRGPALAEAGRQLAQQQADLRLEMEYQRRVRSNPKERARCRRWVSAGIPG